MKTTANIHLLSTNTDSHIFKNTKRNTLGWVTGAVLEDLKQFPNQTGTQNQHLYFTLPQSDLEISKIKEGDYVRIGKRIVKAVKNCGTIGYNSFNEVAFLYFQKNHEKVIATTDKSLGLPSIPQSFIEYYITEYNKKNLIETIEVELEAPKVLDDDIFLDCSYKLKLNNNEIVISETKSNTNLTVELNKQSSFSMLPHPMCSTCRFKNRINTNNEETLPKSKVIELLREAFNRRDLYGNFGEFLTEHNLI